MRRILAASVLCLATSFLAAQDTAKKATQGKTAEGGPAKLLRFQKGETIAYGRLAGNEVHQLAGTFGNWQPTDKVYPLKEVTILVPVENPSKVVALAGNYRDHLGDKPAPKYPEPFYKMPSCLQRHEGEIV